MELENGHGHGCHESMPVRGNLEGPHSTCTSSTTTTSTSSSSRFAYPQLEPAATRTVSLSQQKTSGLGLCRPGVQDHSTRLRKHTNR
eukprot:1275165-Rhodomonas_salina.1